MSAIVRKSQCMIALILTMGGVVNAAEQPTALELVFHDAVRYQPMDPKSASEHNKDPKVALKPVVDKDGKQVPAVIAPLHVYLTMDQPAGKVRQAFAAQEVLPNKKGMKFLPSWNNFAIHQVDGSGLQWQDGRFSGTLAVTVQPDMTCHFQRESAVCRLEFRDLTPGTDGTYQGRYGDYDVKGVVTCEVVKQTDLSQPLETTLMINNALNMPGIGPEAPRGCLNASWRDGKITKANLGDTYNYHLWIAPVETGGLTLRDGKLTGQLKGHVTGHYAGEYVWTIDAVVIGRRVLGSGTGKKNDTVEFPIAINGLIANTADIPDVKTWWLDHENRAREAAGDERYWRGAKPNKPAVGAKPGAATSDGKQAP